MSHRPVRIGFLAGDFPWTADPTPIGKLISAGVMARNMTAALACISEVVPFVPPADPADPAQDAALAAFLGSIDILWADLYPGRSARALRLRHELALPCRVVLNAQGTMPKAAEAMLFPWQALIRPGDDLVFTCAADQAIWRRLTVTSQLREWVVPLPVDTTVFRPRPLEERIAIRERLGVPNHVPLLMYVGRINIQKNLHALVRLLADVRRYFPDTRLCLVGAPDDIVFGEFGVTNTGYVDYLKDLATSCGVADAIPWAGTLFGEDLARAYAAADVLVNLGFYHRENFGLSQAEAQACGVPVVCSDWGGFKDVVVHGETGYRVATTITKHGVRMDTASAVRHVLELIGDVDSRSRMGERAAVHARTHFAIPAVANRLAAIAEPSAAMAPGGDRVAYTPSEFARRYEEHKRACGWYDPRRTASSSYQAMFQGPDYELYETLMAPYATRVAGEGAADDIALTDVPNLCDALELDPTCHTVRSLDPIWPHEQPLTAVEWRALVQVGGATTVADIVRAMRDSDEPETELSIRQALCRLRREGFIASLPAPNPLDNQASADQAELGKRAEWTPLVK